MAAICNRQQQRAVPQESPSGKEKTELYGESEKHIESGSAYFAQAFAEALGYISDLELHDLYRAELRLRSMSILITHALEEYDNASKFDARTGLIDYHERMLREAGLNFEGTQRALLEAGNRDLLPADEQLVNSVAKTFDQVGYQGLTNLYLDKVYSIHRLVSSPPVTMEDEGTSDGVAWQELGWKLITLFTQATQIGQSIAVLNTFTERLSRESRQA
jgi:hypothetical protein